MMHDCEKQSGVPAAEPVSQGRGPRETRASKARTGHRVENMTLAEGKALLTRFAKAAGAGELLNIHDLKAAYGPSGTRPATARSIIFLPGMAGAS
jgi:hypothetical protein